MIPTPHYSLRAKVSEFSPSLSNCYSSHRCAGHYEQSHPLLPQSLSKTVLLSDVTPTRDSHVDQPSAVTFRSRWYVNGFLCFSRHHPICLPITRTTPSSRQQFVLLSRSFIFLLSSSQCIFIALTICFFKSIRVLPVFYGRSIPDSDISCKSAEHGRRDGRCIVAHPSTSRSSLCTSSCWEGRE